MEFRVRKLYGLYGSESLSALKIVKYRGGQDSSKVGTKTYL